MKDFLKKLAEFFQEENGQLSNMRLNSTVAVWAGIAFAFASMYEGKFDATIITYSLALVGFGFGAKVIQNGQEFTPTPVAEKKVGE